MQCGLEWNEAGTAEYGMRVQCSVGWNGMKQVQQSME